ncbi:cellulose synthase catalytic subunit [Hymenobacter tibetensis]|uniref:Cellulose synthase catalytic subunit n=1 Tax=Hymenobacter tibetensis TaxID=497967 RepID=A0ABY4D389_9BACT|nr:cellulose synthase catalytic subunit [Hymenobacter tibetensis]UOG76998.1 cellulose synthase catalytic subunit [Hymenobacter tibetensis]
MRILVAIGCVLLFQFIWWFADINHVGHPVLFWLLTFSLGFKFLRTLHEWYHYVSVREPVAPVWKPTYAPTVDVLTTACPGEPYDMIVRTLQAMKAIRYPHTSYLCDEGNDPYLRRVCEQLGVVHVTRIEKTHAKAGNINNALRGATGELCVVLDPDHVPTPDFLDEVVPYFQDAQVGFVQVVQAYGNQHESLVARGAAEQTYHFYGPLLMGMNAYNTAQAIGANCTFRRAALDSIGGHASGLTEDMHTAMRLHAKKWKGVYVPKVLSRGLVPASLAAFYSQQLKWSRGAFDLLFKVYPRLFADFSWRQRIHYLLLPLYFFSGVVTLIDLTVPMVSMITTSFPWRVGLVEFAIHIFPFTVVSLLIRACAQRWLREPHEAGLHLAGGILRVGSWWVYSLGWLYAILNIKVPYIPTPKEGRPSTEWLISLPNLIAALLLIAAAKYGRGLSLTQATQFMSVLVLFNAAILLTAVAMAQHGIQEYLIGLAAKPQPLRKLLLALDQLRANVSRDFIGWLRPAASGVAVGLLVLYGTASFLLYSYTSHYMTMEEQWWPTRRDTGLHLGQMVAAPAATSALAHVDIMALDMPTNSTPQQLQVLRQSLEQHPNVSLLTFSIGTVPLDTASLLQLDQLQLAKLDKPVMVRPLLTATSPAQYRRDWQKMVRHFAQADRPNILWVWTPPKADSLKTYFPGINYVNWVAVDGRQTPTEPAEWYSPIRAQLAPNIELHSKPVLLLMSATEKARLAPNQLAKVYPEVQAVVFDVPGNGVAKQPNYTSISKTAGTE